MRTQSVSTGRLLGALIAAALACAAGPILKRSEPAHEDAGPIRLKTDPGRLYLVSRHAISNLAEVSRLEWSDGPKAWKAVENYGLRATGPIEYHVYFDAAKATTLDDAVSAATQLEIAIPVEEQRPAPDYEFKRAGEFKCLAVLHAGSLMNAVDQWRRLYAQAAALGLQPSGENRELVVDHTGYDRSKYLTELQLGVK